MAYLDNIGLARVWSKITNKLSSYVPTSRKINGKALSSDITLTSSDIGLATAGSATQPVYFSDGKPVATTYTLGKSVPSDAKFTDTIYSNMVSSSASSAGKAGLVPAPAAGDQNKYLRGDGTWAYPASQTTITICRW